MVTREIVGRKHRGTILIDAADAWLLDAHPWHILHIKCGDSVFEYASTTERNILLHRVLLEPAPGLVVDHRNHNGLDNRRCNLRLATRSQNNANSRKVGVGLSRFKGVAPYGGRWVAVLAHQKLGSFPTEELAARAYDAAAREAFGEFSCLNFPREGERSALRPPTDPSPRPAEGRP